MADTKTSLEQRATQLGARIGNRLTPTMEMATRGDDGLPHLIRFAGFDYGLLIEIDGDTWAPPDGASLDKFP